MVRRAPFSCIRWPRRGFTLVELLVAILVLVLLGYLVAQITGAAMRVTRLSNRMIDTASQARLAFGCLATDLAALVKRPDVPFAAQNAALGATDLLDLVAGVTSAGLDSARDVSIVAYQVAPCAANRGPDGQPRSCLIRAGKALGWTTTGYFGLDAAGLPTTFAGLPASTLPQPADFDLVAPGVIRLVIGFQLYPDNGTVTLQDGTQIDHAQGQLVYSPPVRTVAAYGGAPGTVRVIDLSRIAALVAGLVVVDAVNLSPLDAGQVGALGGAFPVPANGDWPVPAWGALAASPATLSSQVPLPARQSLRVFERAFPVTSFGSRP